MTGRLIIRNGLYYGQINYKDNFGNYKKKLIPTGLKERGNKKEAQRILDEALENFNIQDYSVEKPLLKNDIIFMDYMDNYVNDKLKDLSPATTLAYLNCVKIMRGYFGDKLKLKDITYHHLIDYYDYLKNERKNTNTSVKHHAIILSPALRQAYRDDLIAKNPYEFMPKIKREKTIKNYYDENELLKLFEITDKTRLALIVRVAAFYGLRRSELLGLKWESIDTEKQTISIAHKILNINRVLYKSDKLKTDASYRTLPLLPEIQKLIFKRKEEIEHNKMIYGKSYNTNFDEYIFVDDIGKIILPNYVTQKFNKILKKNNLKHIRFHDLRHSCASLLVAKGIPMKSIQEWLGHANYNTTADVYSHTDFSQKVKSGEVITQSLTNYVKQSEIQDEPSLEDLEKEIKRLTLLFEEKEKKIRKSKSSDLEM